VVTGYGLIGILDVINVLKSLWKIIKALSTRRPHFSESGTIKLIMKCRLDRRSGYKAFAILGASLNAYASVTAVPNRGYSKLEASGEFLEVSAKPYLSSALVKVSPSSYIPRKSVRTVNPQERGYRNTQG